MTNHYCLVLCTCPDATTAHRLAEALVKEQLAACVNIVPGLTSVYPWQGKIETAHEQLLLIKTETAAFDSLQTFLKAIHPYQTPEIIAVPIQQGSSDYLQWITACLHPAN